LVYSINSKKILKFYYYLKRLREVDLEISRRYSDGKMRCPVHLSVGQEAISAAFQDLVRKQDFAISTHRNHFHYLAKGGDLKKMIAELYGKATGCSKGKGGSMHLIDLNVNFMGASSIVGNSIPIGVGLGFSSKLKKKNNISYIFFGDGAVEEGVFFESLNFAILKDIPTIFICENNLYSVYSPMSVRRKINISINKIVKSFGIKTYKCNGNDVFKAHDLLNKAINYSKTNKKPVFLEFYTYRWLEHCGPNFDNDLNYRSKKEFNYWTKKQDPINFILKKKKKKKINSKKISLIDLKIKSEILKAFKYAENSKFPSAKEAFKGVYAE